MFFAVRSFHMMPHSQTELSVSAGYCCIGAVTVMILPLPLLGTAFLAAAIHECCHMLVLRICVARISQIHIGIGGAVIQTDPLPPLQELLCAAAGPVGSLLCLLAVRHFPLLALCGLFQGLYNLLPIHPLDGGRILHCLGLLWFPTHAERVCEATKWCISFFLMAAGMMAAIRTQDILILLFVAYFFFNTLLRRKIPCKEGRY